MQETLVADHINTSFQENSLTRNMFHFVCLRQRKIQHILLPQGAPQCGNTDKIKKLSEQGIVNLVIYIYRFMH